MTDLEKFTKLMEEFGLPFNTRLNPPQGTRVDIDVEADSLFLRTYGIVDVWFDFNADGQFEELLISG